MARTAEQIKLEMTQNLMQNSVFVSLFGLDSNQTFEQQISSVSLINIILYVCAFGLSVVERFFDTHRAEVEDYILRMKPHSAAWYVTKAKEFLLGFNLPPDSDRYDLTGIDEETITAAQIVKYAAVTDGQNFIRMKVAKENNGALAPLDNIELGAFTAYMERVKDAGVWIDYKSDNPDYLRISMQIFYNPLVLRADGKRIDDGTEPVPIAIRNYINSIEFDGRFITTHMVDAVQAVEGVRFVHIQQIQGRYANTEWLDIQGSYAPFAGYMIIDDNDLNLQYLIG